MRLFYSKRLSIAFQGITCLLALSACIWTQSIPQTAGVPVTAGAPTGATPGVPAGPTAEATAGEIQANVEFGTGPFSLEDPAVGLADLSSYKATLRLSFDGTQDGQPKQWSRTYVMLASREPAARQITIETAGGVTAPVFMAEVNGVSYKLDGENNCTASTTEAGSSLADNWEPAGFLTPIIGADAAGSETINGVVTDQYTFDERALGEAGFSHSTGQVWVASENGYLVRYLLTTTAGPDYFGEGVDGTLTWEYNLTDVNQPVLIDLSRAGTGTTTPAACPGGLVDAPLMPDAQSVSRLPDLTIYSTAGSIADVLALYQEQLRGLGWTADGEPGVTDSMGLADFVQGDQQLSVIASSSNNVVIVRLVMGTVPSPGVMP